MATRRDWAAFAALILGLLLVVMDQTITAVVLPDIVADLGADVAAASLTVTVFTVAAASTFVLFGRVADSWGRRRVATVALVGFAAGSLVTGMATNLPVLLLGRAVQGFVLAAFAPASVGLINSLFPSGRARTVAFSFWATASGSGVAIGPVVGGALADALSWRAPFFANIPLALIAAAGLRWLMPESKAGGPLRVDPVGTLLLAVGMAGLVVALQEGGSWGWWTAKDGTGLSPTPFALAAGLGALALFAGWQVRRNRAAEVSLVDGRLLRVRSFVVGIGASSLMSMALYGIVLVLPIFTQFILGDDSLTSGLVLMSMGVGMVLGGIGGSALINRFGHRRMALICLTVQPVFLLATVPLIRVPESGWVLAPTLFAYGLGYGTGFSALTNLVFRDVPHDLSSLSGGVSSTVRLGAGAIASALMVGVVTGMSAGGISGELDKYPQLTGQQRGQLEQAAHFATGGGSDSSGTRDQVLNGIRSDPTLAGLVTDLNDRFVTATRVAIGLAAGLAAGAAVMAGFLPREPRRRKEGAMTAPELVEEFFTRVDAGDLSSAGELLADDFAHTSTANPEPMGRDDYLAALQQLDGAISQLHHRLTELAGDDATATGVVQVSARHTGRLVAPALGVDLAPTGRVFQLPSEPLRATARNGRLTLIHIDTPPGGGLAGAIDQLTD